MFMVKFDIKINAGIIYSLLSEKEKLSYNEIEELTQFNIIAIGLALGWLAHENKIDFIKKYDMIYVAKAKQFNEMYY